jgi:hypothetical protein
MIKKATTREQEVFERLVASNKFLCTGKVLIGLTHQPKPPPMTRDEEFLQNMLLGNYRPLFRRSK